MTPPTSNVPKGRSGCGSGKDGSGEHTEVGGWWRGSGGGLVPSRAFTLPTPSGLAAYSTSVDLGPDGQVLGKCGLAWWGRCEPTAPGPTSPREQPQSGIFSASSFMGAPSPLFRGCQLQLLVLRLRPHLPCFCLPTPNPQSSVWVHRRPLWLCPAEQAGLSFTQLQCLQGWSKPNCRPFAQSLS